MANHKTRILNKYTRLKSLKEKIQIALKKIWNVLHVRKLYPFWD